MNPLDLLPLPYRLAIIGFLAMCAAAAIFAYGHSQHSKGLTQGRAEVQAVFDAYKVQVQSQAIAARDAAIKAQQAAADETVRRINDQQEAARNHEKALDQARADAAAAAGAVTRLQHRIKQLAASNSGSGPASGNPSAASVSTPAERLGAVASESVERYSALAEAARRGLLSGNECAARYDALTKH